MDKLVESSDSIGSNASDVIWKPNPWIGATLLAVAFLLFFSWVKGSALLPSDGARLQILIGAIITATIGALLIYYEQYRGQPLCIRLNREIAELPQDVGKVLGSGGKSIKDLKLRHIELWHVDWKSLVLSYIALSLSWIIVFSWITVLLHLDTLLLYVIYGSYIVLLLDCVAVINVYYNLVVFKNCLYNPYYLRVEEIYRDELQKRGRTLGLP